MKQTEIWGALAKVADPEIPVVSLLEMGIIRELAVEGKRVTVTITPTFSGCPALEVMKADIRRQLGDLGVTDVSVETRLSPPWSSDWISGEARAKLKAFGISPAPLHGGMPLAVLSAPVHCAYCDSTHTEIRNNWGPTPCRMICTCNDCRQPFEQFKPL
jgi:ring-1,2-phenylacetyl-CoA epoxidase subunit PaaD